MLQIGTDVERALGLHPRLTGLKQIFDQGRLAFIQRTGYRTRADRTFTGTDIWSTGEPGQLARARLGRPLSRLAAVAGRSAGRLEHDRRLCRTCCSRHVGGAGDSEPDGYAFSSPNTGAEAAAERTTAVRIASHVPVDRPELAFVVRQRAGGDGDARSRRDRRHLHAAPSPYPTTGFGQALQGGRRRDGRKASARKVFYVHDRRLRHALRRRTSTRPTARTTT